jgi:copper chaperone CopZ
LKVSNTLMNTSLDTTFELSGLHCGKCVARVSKALKPFATEVKVSLNPMQVNLQGLRADASVDRLQAAVRQAGAYDLKEDPPQAHIPPAQSAIDSVAISPALSTSWLRTYQPLLLILAFILGSSILVQLGQHAGHGMGLAALSTSETMRYFMAGFFLVFAFFKLLDIRAFADAYASYDLLAARWHGWGLIYPFVELALGIAYLAHWQPAFTHWATLIIMGFSALGVIRAVMRKSQIQCACLGTVFKLPMSTVTIVEDVGMVLMAAAMLFVLPS